MLSRKTLQYITKRRNFQGQTTQKSLIIKRLTYYAEQQARQEKEVHALPFGFAFSETQFEEMKIKLGVTENSELYRLGDTGGFYRKTDSELIHRTFKRHAEERKNAIFTKSGINAEYVQSMFYYEMCNHEFGINWDGTADVLSACDITMEQLNSTPELKQAWNAAKKQYYAAAEKNSWF